MAMMTVRVRERERERQEKVENEGIGLKFVKLAAIKMEGDEGKSGIKWALSDPFSLPTLIHLCDIFPSS